MSKDYDIPRTSQGLDIEEADARIDRLEGVLDMLRQWARAYPLSVFPEPDFDRAHKVLTAAGMTLDAISAHNMRYVVTRMEKIIDEALGAPA